MRCQKLEWQLPLGLQMIPSLILAIGILFCPFSPRWLIYQDREDEAKDVLVNIRSVSDDEIEAEIDRIKIEVAFLREHEIDSYRQLVRLPLCRPFLLGVGIQILQQLTGVNAIIYYAPTIFQIFIDHSSVSSNGSIDRFHCPLIIDNSSASDNGTFNILHYPLITTGIYGVINFAFTIPTMILIDKMGRRILLISGAVVMSISIFIASILIRAYINKTCMFDSDFCIYTLNPAAPEKISVIIIIFIYVFAAAFAFSWGPIPWIYCTEIFPLTMRAKASSLTTAANWTINCLVSFVVPVLLRRIYVKTFIIFAAFCAMMIGIIYLFYPETKNIHLEENTTNENTRIFVPQWLENKRKVYRSFQQQFISVNETNVPVREDQRLMNQPNDMNRLETVIDRNDYQEMS